jgi:hypothetical protein
VCGAFSLFRAKRSHQAARPFRARAKALAAALSRGPLIHLKQVGELDEAIALYEAQLAELEAATAADPGNAEAAELLAQLQEALSAARDARASLQPGAAGAPTNAAEAEDTEADAEAGGELSRARAAPTRMHPDNTYFDREPDFAALAERYPGLKPYLVHPVPGEGVGAAVMCYLIIKRWPAASCSCVQSFRV